MRCSVIALIVEITLIGLLAAHEGRSQDLDQKIHLSLENADIKESLLAIEKVGNVRFIIRDDLFTDSRRQVSLKAKDITIRQAISEVLANTPFIFQELDGFVAIINRNQQRVIQGRIVDAERRTAVIGVSVQVKGMASNTAISNTSGNFSIPVPAETATLVFSSLGYQTKEVRVSVADGFVNVQLTPVQIELDEVTVAASKRVNTEIALLEERRKAAIIQDGISAQQIDRTASITTTQALQRVTGVTVTDEKYVAVRGLGERSVIGQLNGVRLASSDPDRATIPLDLVPASLLDNIVVYKTVTPDKPADAAAGIIELKTKSIPDSMTLEFIVETGTNTTIGFGGRVNSFHNNDMGFWGDRINGKNLRPDFLALADQYPNGLGSIQQMIANAQYSPDAWAETERINGIMRHFDPVMTTRYKGAKPNQLYSLTFGNQYNVFKKHKIGVIFGGNYYKRMTDIHQGELTQYSIYQGVVTGNDHIFSWRNIPNYITPNRLYMGRYQSYQENTGVETLNYGVLGGLTYRFSPRHEIGFQYLGSRGGENMATNMFGGYMYTGLPGEVNSDIYSLKQSYRTLNTYNVQGEHQFGKGEYAPRLSYNAATSSSSQNDPDYRFVSLATYLPNEPVLISNLFDNPLPLYPSGAPNFTTDRLYALTSGYVNGYGVYGRLQAEPNGRRWRFLKEINYNYKADMSFPFPFLGIKQEFKVGFNYLYRDRSFSENLLMLPGSNYSEGRNRPIYRVFGDLDRLVGPEVVGVLAPTPAQREGAAPIGGFLYNSQKSPNNYTGFYETNAYYGMLDLRLTDNFRLAGGVRFERTDIRSAVDTAGIFLDPALTVPNEDGARVPLIFIEPNSVYTANYKPYYSVNATYMLNEKMNLRGAFNTTLARPELREITNVFEFDAFQMGLVIGNPNLVNQHTKNLDFRWEWFPHPGEVLAFSAFGKEIHNQLVRVFDLRTEGLKATSQEYPTIQYQNDANIGYVWGVELEVVKNLGTVWAPLSDFFIGTNLMLAQSQIKKSWDRYQANMSLDRNTPENSPLFEQPPYSFNGWFNYANMRWGTDLTATFNIVGERLVQINLTGEPDLYSRPVPMLDFVFSQRITKRILLKGFAKNVLNPAIKTVYSSYGTAGTWYGNEYINRSYKRGSEIMLGLSYNIF
ncbi:TonB-dependent receptor domain-containing protein [Parapedobacter deserti]|uniref:TonB-dependent receptor domain-containing protein n=1 Tax=Parapedobacter deserti TaxID=1912957 RepID=A0ABV7JFE3_9SPHI